MLWTFLQSSSFIPLMTSQKKIFEYFFANQSNSDILTKFIWLVEDHSRNISVKLLSKYLQWDTSKSQFPFPPPPHYKSVATICCHSNQSSDPIGTKKKEQYFSSSSPPPPPPRLPIDAICEIWQESASWLQRRCRLLTTDGRKTTDGRRTPAYTISSPMSLWLRWAKKK